MSKRIFRSEAQRAGCHCSGRLDQRHSAQGVIAVGALIRGTARRVSLLNSGRLDRFRFGKRTMTKKGEQTLPSCRGAGRYFALVRQNERGVRGSSPGKF